MSLSKNPNRDVDIDTQYGYLSELAYILFSGRVLSLDYSQLNVWHMEYCQKYKLLIDQKRILDYLCAVEILQESQVGVSFRYPYMYYYFVARYFRDHITEDEIRKHIQHLSERLHHTESANIIIFLCYLSKDPFILSMLLDASKKLFTSYHECDLIHDTKSISNSIPDLPRIVLEEKDIEENRKKILLEQDEIDGNQDDSPETKIGEEKADKDLQEILQVNVAFKTIQILGQLLRNFPGSLKRGSKT